MKVFRDPAQKLIEFTEFIAPDGALLKLDTRTRFLVSETGYGMPPIKYISQQGPFQHGKTVYDYRLDQRVIQLVVRENECNRQGYWDIRANLLNYLRPNRQVVPGFSLGTLIKTLPDGTRWAIDVTIEQGPEFRARELGKWDEWSVYETVRFIAPDPTFYNPDTVILSAAAVSTGQLVLPFEFDDETITFPTSTAGSFASFDILYDGTWLAFPDIVITGPLDGPIVDNLSTGEKLDLSAINVASGEVVTISLAFGRKTIVSSVNGNIIGYLSNDSDLATFHIAPDPEASGGSNSITVSGTGVVAGVTSATLSYNERYIGI